MFDSWVHVPFWQVTAMFVGGTAVYEIALWAFNEVHSKWFNESE